MKFTSFEFIIFLITVFALYWFAFRNKTYKQNVLLLISSYFFYGYWDYRFLILIIVSSLTDYLIGIGLDRSNKNKERKWLLFTSIFVNIGLLIVFKYFNFFSESLQIMAANLFGIQLGELTLNLILPVGISFYTFQTLSYTIDIYNQKIKSTSDPIAFFAYVAFFPQLVAGPIERARNLLPQFTSDRMFDYKDAKNGLRQILWGVFKKIVIADNLGTYVDQIFAHPGSFSGSELLLGGIYFGIQIYCDFSGYSDIAIGTARLFGFQLMQNFNYPYFSRDISEFWRRWHISLSSWFRDYLYIPLGGSRVQSKFRLLFNVMAIFLVSGLWHGANWTFVIWGFLNALFFLPYILLGKNRVYTDHVAQGKYLPSLKEFTQITITFFLTVFCWIFFRAESLTDALVYLNGMIDISLFSLPATKLGGIPLVLLLIIEWFGREKSFVFEDFNAKKIIRWLIYIVLMLLVIMFMGEDKTFIYFQF